MGFSIVGGLPACELVRPLKGKRQGEKSTFSITPLLFGWERRNGSLALMEGDSIGLGRFLREVGRSAIYVVCTRVLLHRAIVMRESPLQRLDAGVGRRNEKERGCGAPR